MGGEVARQHRLDATIGLEYQVPLDVKVSDEMVAKGAEAVSAEVAAAMKQAHAKSGAYMQQRMAELYKELGIAEPPKQ